MRFRILIPLSLMGVACLLPHAGPGGLLERSTPDVWAVFVHLVVPGALAVALAVLWPRQSWYRSVLALAGCLLLAQVARMVLFALPSGHQIWNRLLSDSKDQFLLVLSLSMQLGCGLLAFTAARIVVRRAAQPAAAAARSAADDPSGGPGAVMLVRIAFTRSLAEAGRIQSLLESRGFHPMPVDSSSHVSVAGAELGYHVEIPRREARSACAFLKQAGLGNCLAT